MFNSWLERLDSDQHTFSGLQQINSLSTYQLVYAQINSHFNKKMDLIYIHWLNVHQKASVNPHPLDKALCSIEGY